MAVFSNIGLQEPSTITGRVATVSINRGSTAEQQEILVLGDPETSNAIARVLNAAPASTDWGVVVRPVGASTTVNVSSVAGVVAVAQDSTVWAVQSAQAGAWTVRATLSSTSADNPVTASQAGAWTVRATLSSTSADNPVSAAQAGTWDVRNVSSVAGKVAVVNSSAADLNVTVAGYSTIAAISSVAGIVAVRPSDTNWASSAGFHFNSSGELLTRDAGNSTTVAVSSLGGIVAIRPSDTNWASSAGFHFDSSGGLQISGTFNATTSTIVTVSQLLDSSGGSVAMADSANQALRVNVVAGAAGGSTIVTVSTGSIRVHQSTAADLQATVTPASTVWAVQLSNYSTIAAVSSVGGVVKVQQNSTVWAVQLTQWSTTRNVSSLAGVVKVTQNSTVWNVQARLFDGVSNALVSATSNPSSNAQALAVRPVIHTLLTYSASTTGQSSATTIISSNATTRGKVFAYSITSTLAGPVEWGIYNGATRLWGGVLAAPSSAISGVNLAVSPPAYLFANSTGAALTFNVASSNAGMNVSLAYWLST